MRAITITADLMFQLKVLIISIKVKIHIISISNCELYIARSFIRFYTLFVAYFVYFQNEAAGLCVNNPINKDVN